MSAHDLENKQSFFAFQEQSLIVSPKLFCDAEIRIMEPGAKYPDTARRALALRILCGYPGHGNQKKFAEWLGVTGPRWGNVERGVVPFSPRIIKIIKRRLPAIDTEWLQEGSEAKMPLGLMREINQILETLEDPPVGKDKTPAL